MKVPTISAVAILRRASAPLLLFLAAMAFWPLFAVLTVLEEKVGLTWFQTERPALWVPVATVALLCAAVAPLLRAWSGKKRIVAMLGSTLSFVLMYGIVVLIGIHFLSWDN